MRHPATPTLARAARLCAFAAFTALCCAALLTAAVLVPAPPVVLPFLILVSIGCPMAAACELPRAAAALRGALRARRVDHEALEGMRRQLRQLPEREHPLGL